MKAASSISKDIKLAESLGIAQSTLAGWKSRGTIDISIIIDFCDNFNVNLDWLLTGNGEKFRTKKVDTPIDSKKVVDIDAHHDEIIRGFEDKETAREMNLDLLTIEKLNKTVFRETGTYIKGVANTLKSVIKETQTEFKKKGNG